MHGYSDVAKTASINLDAPSGVKSVSQPALFLFVDFRLGFIALFEDGFCVSFGPVLRAHGRVIVVQSEVICGLGAHHVLDGSGIAEIESFGHERRHFVQILFVGHAFHLNNAVY